MLMALLGMTLLGGQAVTDRTCLDDNGRDVCATANRTDLMERLNMPSAEEAAASRIESYRAFFVDGYGRDMPAFAFERRPGQGPVSIVYGFDGARLEAPISPSAWAEIIARAEFADRELVAPAPVTGSAVEPPAICLHAWHVTVEMTNSPLDRWRNEAVRRRAEGTCDGALATRYAFFLAEEALKAQPHCQALNPAQQRNAVTTVAACLAFQGDRVAAGQVHDAKSSGGPRWGSDMLDAGNWRAWLGTNGSPRLDWNGEVVATERGRDNRVAEFIVARLTETPSLKFYPTRYEGLDARTVRVTGTAERTSTTDENVRTRAEYAQTWVWDINLSDWMVSDWRVGAFEAPD